MKRISQKMLMEFINNVADLKPSNIPDDDSMCYYSKIDGAYFTRKGMEDDFKVFLKKGITKELQSAMEKTVSLGFNPTENKWYGWSHRAIYGFGIGSTCKPGDCHYNSSNKLDFIEECRNFWEGDEYHLNTTAESSIAEEGIGVQVSWTYNDKVPNKHLRGTIGGSFTPYPDEYGRGRWEAKTLEDAKQMAIDFAEGVS